MADNSATDISNRASEGFDPFSAAVMARGPQAYVDLARDCPVYHYDGTFDFFIVSDFADVSRSVLGDKPEWTVENGTTPKPMPPEMCIALNSDSPRATKVRYVVQRGFSPAELKRLSEIVLRIADDLIDAMLALPEARGNFYALLSMPLPARLNCVMMGLPEESYQTVKTWADTYFYDALNEPNSKLTVEDGRVFSEPVFDLIRERRALLAGHGLEPDLAHVGTVLPNDFLSRFMCDRVEGEGMNDAEIHSLMVGLILGGNETTMMLLGNLLWRLLEDRSRWEAVKADPSLIEVAIEECLRLDPPIYGMFRSTRADVSLAGGTIPQGAKALYNIPALNRNPDLWPNPDEFRLDRPLTGLRRHLSFGKGKHSCLGAPLARMEVKAVFERLIERLPDLELDGEPGRARGFSIFGRTHLPVRWGGI